MRTFLAFDLDERFVREAVALTERLRTHPSLARARIRWAAASTMHVTVRFLGDTGEALLPGLQDLVARLGERRGSIRVRASSLLAFPDARRARIVAIDFDAAVMSAIGAEAELGARALGFAPEQRTYRPHLTLARVREPTDARPLFADAATTPSFEGHVTAITLYESVLGRDGSTYTPLARTRIAA